jgi:DNA-binding transcriptional regulator GbsR (MarR family)
MKTNTNKAVEDVRSRLIEVAGRTTQDLGMGRIIGQVMGYVYLTRDECSLDDIGTGLGLSKAAVSIAARQLEHLGLLQRVWKTGDRRNYYRTVRHFGVALREGLLGMVRAKVNTISSEFDRAEEILAAARQKGEQDPEVRFIRQRLSRARTLRNRVVRILDSPIAKLLGRKRSSRKG